MKQPQEAVLLAYTEIDSTIGPLVLVASSTQMHLLDLEQRTLQI